MRSSIHLAAAISACLAFGSEAQEVRVGMLVTLTGGQAILGQHMINGWKIGLNHEGWRQDGDKVSGAPLRMFYADDQFKVDVALRETERLISREGVQIMTGLNWSHILLAVSRPLVESRRIMLSLMAGPSPIAGKDCTPYFVATTFTATQAAEAAGELLNGEAINRLYLMSPNYQAGKDALAGVTSKYKGNVVGQSLYKLGESDYQADLSRLRAAKPQAVFFFGPGSMGISFVRQWAASGLGKEIRLYVHYLDEISQTALGDDSLGIRQVTHWPSDHDNATNRNFIKHYTSAFGHKPSYYAASGYDGARLLAAALRKTGGHVDDTLKLARELRHTPYDSTRGYFAYNVNGLPILDFYKSEIARGSDGLPTSVTHGVVVKGSKDPYWQECPAEKRL